MKTLLQAAIEFEASQGGRSMGNWSETEGAPYIVTNSRDAFMAGAAAMAEIFASGQAFKVEQLPRKYLVRSPIAYISASIVTAFNREDAIKQAGFSGDGSAWDLEVRPATEDDEKIEGVIHV